MTVVVAVDCLVERCKLLLVIHLALKADNVHSHTVLLQLLCNLDQCLLVLPHWGRYKYDDALPLVLVLPVLQSQLCNLHSCCEIRYALNIDLLHAVQHFAQVRGGGDQHLGSLASHGEDAHGVLGVCLAFGSRQEVDSIRLSMEPGGCVIPRARVLRVVHQCYQAFTHGCPADTWSLSWSSAVNRQRLLLLKSCPNRVLEIWLR
mmetsp:Transcript_8531/g.14662  ORF Transcript_8531/g.14662 Transcript_8531/m.14662 type:complete len:204 (-) Transcript_8531:82-693(-)